MLAVSTAEVEAPVEVLAELMAEACWDLATMIASDGEETTRVVQLEVVGATSDEAARVLGLKMSDSDLVRASFYGGDPNWGRLFQAAGVSGVEFDVNQFAVEYDGTPVAAGGMQLDYPPLSLDSDFTVKVSVGSGPGQATILTTDLTPGYVTFNGAPS